MDNGIGIFYDIIVEMGRKGRPKRERKKKKQVNDHASSVSKIARRRNSNFPPVAVSRNCFLAKMVGERGRPGCAQSPTPKYRGSKAKRAAYKSVFSSNLGGERRELMGVTLKPRCPTLPLGG